MARAYSQDLRDRAIDAGLIPRRRTPHSQTFAGEIGSNHPCPCPARPTIRRRERRTRDCRRMATLVRRTGTFPSISPPSQGLPSADPQDLWRFRQKRTPISPRKARQN